MAINQTSIIGGRERRVSPRETARLQGLHTHQILQVPPASSEEVGKVATALMKKLDTIEPDPANRSWFKLFKQFGGNFGAEPNQETQKAFWSFCRVPTRAHERGYEEGY